GSWVCSILATVVQKCRSRGKRAPTSSRSECWLCPVRVRGAAECDTSPVGTSGGEFQMNKLTKLAAAGVLSLCTAAPALDGSVTQPGVTAGLNTGAVLPQVMYAIH